MDEDTFIPPQQLEPKEGRAVDAEEAPLPDAAASLAQTVVLYTSLQVAYTFFNDELFSAKLPPVLFTLQRKKGMAGYFHHKKFSQRLECPPDQRERIDEIAINPESIATHSDLYVLQVLLHEMCHVWQTYYGKPSRSGYHNLDFAREMERVGLMTSTNGTQTGKRVGQSMADYIIPGGRFSQVAQHHLDAGWHFSWEDVGPLRNRVIHIPVHLDTLIITPVKDETGQTFLVATEEGQTPQVPVISADIKPLPIEQLPDEIRTLLPEPGTPLKDITTIFVEGTPVQVMKNVAPPPPKKVSRHKFKCPECATSAWAKPGTRMLCYEHNVEMGKVGAV